MADAVKRNGWGRRLTMLAVLLCLGSVLAALIGALGSGQGAWHFRVGFKFLEYAFYAAGAGVVLALIALFVGRHVGRKLVIFNVLGLVAAAGFLIYLGNQIRTARSVVALHDITTNLDDVPQFGRLTVRPDNMENIPDLDRPELEALAPEERWKAVHRQAYGDLATVRVPWSVAETIQRAERVARQRGWEIAHVDPAGGTLEATETTRFFRFKDDVVVRARPAGGGTGSLVDMRSISRVGGSDVGVNARRVRAFLQDLQRS